MASSSQSNELVQVTRPVIYHYEDLKKFTNNFSERLGSGASGSVFKGKLDDESPVAIKKIDGGRNAKVFFEAEIYSIGGIHHDHLVPLRGYCSHQLESGGDALIVYDFFPNGSLDTWIFPHTSRPSDRFLSWKQRYQVAVDVARALAYIHHECSPQILHLDVKPGNILLNENRRAVLCDFGLAKLVDNVGAGAQTENIRGTYGYKAPEVLTSNLVTLKCDMYSFGKVLLDLFFGQLYVCFDKDGVDIYEADGNSMREHKAFHAFMWEKWGKKGLEELVDKRMLNRYVNIEQVYCLVHVALSCLKHDPNERPKDMQEVLLKLEDAKEQDENLEETPWDMLDILVCGAYDVEPFPGTRIYANIEFGGEKLTTRQVKKTRDPKWDEGFTFPLDGLPTNMRDDTILVVVYGSDNGTGMSDGFTIARFRFELGEIFAKKHVNRRYSPINGKRHPQIHLECKFRFGSGIIPRFMFEGTLVVVSHDVRYLFEVKVKEIFLNVHLKGQFRGKGKLVSANMNPKWEEEFSIEVNETSITQAIVISLSEIGSPIIYSTHMNIRRAVQRGHSNMWYQLPRGPFKSNPEIKIETKWIPRSSF